jgi:hypothetical protein
MLSKKVYPAFSGACPVNALTFDCITQPDACLILMDIIFFKFKDKNILLAQLQKFRHVFLFDDMTFLKKRRLGLSPDNLCDIMADYLPNCILNSNCL